MTICVFAKEPRPGAVKTRLAATIGDAAAAHLAAAFLEDTLSLVGALGGDAVLAWSGAIPGAPRGVEVWSQGDGDLGERLERVFARALSRSSWAIALGADSPDLPIESLRAAIDLLDTHDAVVGPALDGGYYLLGVRRCEPGLLAGIPWSAPSTCSLTVERLRDRGYVVGAVPAWFDVDDAKDLARLEDRLRQGAAHAPATARALRAHGVGRRTEKSDA